MIKVFEFYRIQKRAVKSMLTVDNVKAIKCAIPHNCAKGYKNNLYKNQINSCWMFETIVFHFK